MELDDLIAYGQVGLAEAARDFDAAARPPLFDLRLLSNSRGDLRRFVEALRAESRALPAGSLSADGGGSPGGRRGEARCRHRLPRQDRDLCWFRDLSRNLAVASLITAVGSCDDAADKSQSDDARTSPPAMAIDKEISQILHQLVNSLPKQESELIRATYFEGLTLQEAGQRMGISKSWATRLHARALERLARSLKVLDLVS